MGWLDILKIVAVAIAGGAAVAATVVIAKKITAARLKAKVAEDFSKAIKLKIKDKSTKTVDVGIFGANNQLIAEKTYESEEGISDELYVGQVLYVNS